MTARAVVNYLDYRLKQEREQRLFEEFLAENSATLAAQMKTKTRVSYSPLRNKIWGVSQKEDNRSAIEIINDVFAKHGLRLKEGEDYEPV